MMPLCAAAQDFGLDINAGIKKKIIKGLNVSASFELRTQDMSSKMERINAGIELSYKPIEYFRFGVGYNFIDKYILKHETNSGNIIDNYWSPRNRVNVFVTGILPIGNFELSLRERYQFTHRSESTAKKWNSAGVSQGNKTIDEKDYHVLRSRVQGVYKIEPIKLSPYFSTELHNDLKDGFDLEKVKLTAGVEYTLKKHHEFEVFYRYTIGISDSDEAGHLVGLGYGFKF